jgi:hypothetical protein
MVFGYFLEEKRVLRPNLHASTKDVYQCLILETLREIIANGIPKASLCFGTISILRGFDLAGSFVGFTIGPHNIHTITIAVGAFSHGLSRKKSTQLVHEM